MTQDKIEKILASVRDLPPMPHTIVKVMQLTKDEETSSREIARII